MSSAEPPSAALPPLSSEAVLLRLLQRSSRNPEDLIDGAVELSLVGLLSRETLSELCKSMGLGDDQSATVLQSQSALALVRARSTMSTGSDASIFPWRGGGAAAAAPSGAQLSIRSLLHPAASEAPAHPTTALALPSAAAGVAQPPTQQPAHPLISPMAGSAYGLRGFDVGSRLASEFKLLERIGQGGGGAVYRARNLLDGTEYAIKRVTFWSRPGAPAASESTARRVLREVHALAQLNHPNVCRYYSAWVETDWPSFYNTVANNNGHASKPAAPPLRLLKSLEAVEDGTGAGMGAGMSSARVCEGTGDASLSGGASSVVGSAADESVAEVSASSGWGASNQASNQGDCNWVDGASGASVGHSNSSLSGLDFIGGGLNASMLGGAAAAMLSGAESGVLAGPSSVSSPPRNNESRWAERFSTVSSNASDEQSWSSSASNSPTSRKATSPEQRRNADAAAVHQSFPGQAISPVPPKRRHAPPSDERGSHNAHAGPPSLLHQWTYRKSLLIQMELCMPNTLKDYLEQRDALAFAASARTPSEEEELAHGGMRGVSVVRSMECLVQICQGLEHVHECGIVHRDLKPANCCFTAAGTLKLMDFGLSRQRPSGRGGSAPGSPLARQRTTKDNGGAPIFDIASADLSFNTRGAGTPSYAAPEQIGGGAVQSSCDLFPLGLIAFELFTAFGSAMERAKAFGELRACKIPAAFTARLPVMSSLITHLLAESPANRPSVTAVLKAIQPSPASPVVSPLTSPVLRAAPFPSPGPDVPSPIEELLGETLASSPRSEPREHSVSPPPVVEHQPSEEEQAGAKAPLKIAVDCTHEAVHRARGDSKEGCGIDGDWRDEELTRRLLEMEILADELRKSEVTSRASDVVNVA